jgi:transcriptional regulator with GAF, ATPase, and Fis domain
MTDHRPESIEVEQLEQREDIKRALKQTAAVKESAAPALEAKQKDIHRQLRAVPYRARRGLSRALGYELSV